MTQIQKEILAYLEKRKQDIEFLISENKKQLELLEREVEINNAAIKFTKEDYDK